MRLLLSTWLTAATALWPQLAAARRPVDNDSDLEIFVSRPDLRPPKFTVRHIDEALVAPGYWFTAPYVDLINRKPTRIYQTKQVGPHIYDNQGQLVWSGAGLFPARNIFDFKLTEQGSPSFLLGPHEKEKDHIGGAGVILNSTYEINKYVQLRRGARTVNMHEFNVLEDGKTALMFMHETRLMETTRPDFRSWIIDLGFVEQDIETGRTLFEWWATDHVHPLESTVEVMDGVGDPHRAWDFFHINSVDKDANGDYLVSARHMNTIYKISGVDGSIIWQLGGKASSFTQIGFNFSSQHDARFRVQNDTTTVITFLNNAADGHTHTASVSSAMVVSLDTSVQPMTATLVRKYDRPDGRRTNLRGNFQILPNANAYVSWSANSYMSEFTQDGRLVLEAHFKTDRFSTYRSYKFDFTGHPSQPPDLVCSAYGITKAQATTVCHTSWNGATEVQSWRFHAAHADGESVRVLGEVDKEGFETMLMSKRYTARVFVEAIDQHGQVLGQSKVVKTKIPGGLPFGSIETDDNIVQAPKPKLADTQPQSNHKKVQETEEEEQKVENQAQGIIHGFMDFGKHIGEMPPLWSMILCVMLGAIGSLLIVHSSRWIRACMTGRKGEKTGHIRVGEA